MHMDDAAALDLGAYLDRIGHAGDCAPDCATLEAIHEAHATSIPFENLDVLLGRPIRLDLGSLQAKLVHGRRGGYCFEQNALLAAALREIGFRATPLAARVRYRATRVLPRLHMLLRVDLADESLLADVGFGGSGPLRPIPLIHGRVEDQYGWRYRLARDEDAPWVLQSWREGGWVDLYAFTMEPQVPADYEMASYYTSTHPDSVFRRGPIVQRATPETRHLIRGDEYIVDRGKEVTRAPIADAAALRRLLVEVFELSVPADAALAPGSLTVP
jgi:N-hydroxyarylamine O-acetyltransferase